MNFLKFILIFKNYYIILLKPSSTGIESELSFFMLPFLLIVELIMLKLLKPSVVLAVISTFSSQYAAGQQAEGQAAPDVAATAPETGAAPGQESSRDFHDFIADGTRVQMDHLGVSLVPPTGWQVQMNTKNLSLVLTEPEKENLKADGSKDYDKPKYRRNITMAAIHDSSPIDELRAEELKKELVKSFGDSSLVTDYQVLEHSFFDYKAKKDGLVVYATMKVGQFQMMQMNILVSGEQKQFLLTYTDLADRFTAQPELMTEGWNSIVSIDVLGQPEGRYVNLIIGGVSVLLVAVLLVMAAIMRRRRLRSLLSESEGDFDADDDSSDWSVDEDAGDKAETDEDLPQVSMF